MRWCARPRSSRHVHLRTLSGSTWNIAVGGNRIGTGFVDRRSDIGTEAAPLALTRTAMRTV